MEWFSGKVAVAIALSALGVALLVFPLVRYLRVGWLAKRNDIMSCFGPRACQLYFRMFHRDGAVPAEDGAVAAFEAIYIKWYGRHFFTAPAVLLALVGAVLLAAIIFTGLKAHGFLAGNPLLDLPKTALAGATGAYMWVVNDFISRARRLDFSPSDVQWATLRLAIAIPMGYAFASLVQDSGPFVAFALGAFPLTTLSNLLRRFANKKLGMDDSAEEGDDALTKLQGVNKTVAERLANEDLTTISQVACCDPVQIAMRSNLSFSSVVDIMNQALAWVYLGEKLNTIRPLGLRGAVEIRHLLADMAATDDSKAGRKAQAQAAFAQVATAIGQSQETLMVVFLEIADDPFTDFLDDVWSCLASS